MSTESMGTATMSERPQETTHHATNSCLSTLESCLIENGSESCHDVVHVACFDFFLQKCSFLGHLLLNDRGRTLRSIHRVPKPGFRLADVLRTLSSQRHSLLSAPSPTMRPGWPEKIPLRWHRQPSRNRSRWGICGNNAGSEGFLLACGRDPALGLHTSLHMHMR